MRVDLLLLLLLVVVVRWLDVGPGKVIRLQLTSLLDLLLLIEGGLLSMTIYNLAFPCHIGQDLVGGGSKAAWVTSIKHLDVVLSITAGEIFFFVLIVNHFLAFLDERFHLSHLTQQGMIIDLIRWLLMKRSLDIQHLLSGYLLRHLQHLLHRCLLHLLLYVLLIFLLILFLVLLELFLVVNGGLLLLLRSSASRLHWLLDLLLLLLVLGGDPDLQVLLPGCRDALGCCCGCLVFFALSEGEASPASPSLLVIVDVLTHLYLNIACSRA